MEQTQKIITQAVKEYMTRYELTRAEMATHLGISAQGLDNKLFARRAWNMNDLDRLTVLGVIQPLAALDVTEFTE